MRKILINEELTHRHRIWGIASETRIWTLSHAINQEFGLQLTREDSTLQVSSSKGDEETTLSPDFHYQDFVTLQNQHVHLLSIQKQLLPADVRPFRYFLILSYIPDITTPPPNWENGFQILKKENIIQAAVDLSHLSELKHIIP